MKPKFNSDKFDLWLGRSSHIAQIILVGVAVFGYFYTIRPIYQNQLLNEDIAKKELELRKINEELDENRKILQSIRDSIETIMNEKDKIIKKLSYEYTNLQDKTVQLQDDFLKKGKIIEDVTSDLENIYTKNFIERVSLIANTQTNRNYSLAEIKQWVNNYKTSLMQVFDNAIKSSFGYGQDYGEQRIPDSTLKRLKNKSVRIIHEYNESIFKSNIGEEINKLVIKSAEIEDECEISKLYNYRDSVITLAKITNDFNEKNRLSKEYTDITQQIIDCRSRIDKTLYELENSFKLILRDSINEFKILLLNKLVI